MIEYILTPDNHELPVASLLMDELHRQGFPVEINVIGENPNWNSIRFYAPGPPEIECTLSFDSPKGQFAIRINQEIYPESSALQLHLVDFLLETLGGRVDNSATRERFDRDQFNTRLKSLYDPSQKNRDRFWVVFAWAVVAAGVGVYFCIGPMSRSMVLFILALSVLSAVGLSASSLKSR